jgi:pimeloyl-ACP methyl ester carboxylesterase
MSNTMTLENEYRSYRKEYSIPNKANIPRELLGLFDLASLIAHIPQINQLPKTGKGETILVLPGYGTDDTIMSPLRKFLIHLGYNAKGWGLGENHGNVPQLLEEVKELIVNLHKESNQKIILIGWSLGGYIGREAAREHQNLVSKVITLGSPIIGGPKYTSIGDLYSKRYNIDLELLEREIDERFQTPLEIPLYSIYSKNDNIVGWEACVDKYSPHITNQEVNSTHIGLIVKYEVYKLLSEYLIH